ncbi:acetylglucosaminylphosphatidylinositol deacetylase [Kitasatospora herbaricolor]|uniref:PIG-L deacetylase family protein n=1 Tax=Kitasatospora herbaricolor TaxID=68217 RepID=UPI00174CF3F0|nr:PIG-L family deacetylase [Kitasatospora herbaricolor]MDQ0306713.1 LmbE family N-acetylglucosaminyl deacetylase [Kitasatospora herbaricolor]GGV46562.1 acetylglucosaminylphosphatidylinositol deacetylase [Kitasatospora herbaricolor]
MTGRPAPALPVPEPPLPPADPIQAPGTPEKEWLAWPGLTGLPAVDPLGALPTGTARSPRVLIVAAHPDDEVLGLGGTIALLAASGVRLRLVSVTAGEASHPRSRAPSARDLAAVRSRELHQALGRLGADVQSVSLGVPDGAVARHELDLTGRLAGLLRDCDLCAAPFSRDLHPDHEAAGRAALRAGAAAGVPVWEYPVWAWHWAVPGDVRLPWHRAARIALPPTARARKQEALECFRSQTQPLGDRPEDAPILPPSELAHFRRDFEVVWR